MKLATLKVPNTRSERDGRDGRLAVISTAGTRAEYGPAEFPTLLSALEDWNVAEPELLELSHTLNRGDGFAIDPSQCMAPLPRTFGWLDGSAFIQHVLLVRKARGAEPPEDLLTVPLMYQGISDSLLGPTDDIYAIEEAHGIDFEGEIAVVVDDVPMGVTASAAEKHIKLILLMNDVSLRNLIPRELATGFGFFHGKPSSSFAPFAVTPDELAESWRECRVHLPLESWLNGEKYGSPNAGEMHFSFAALIEHAAKTRRLSAGTIIGSGTVSNKDGGVGSSCLAEQRMLEKIQCGEMKTPFMKFGDTIEMDMFREGQSVFGRISQKIVRYG